MRKSISLRITNRSLYNIALYFCVFLSCLVPRYISVFKIHAGIDFSMYTVMVVLTWLLFIRQIKFIKNIGSWFFGIWFLFIVCSLWRAQKLGVWASYVLWITIAILFAQIIYKNPDQHTYRIIANALVDGLFVQLMIGLYEIMTHHYLFETGAISSRLFGRVAISTFHNLNDYVTFIVTLMPFAFYRFARSKNLVNRLYCLVVISVSLFLVFRSESRGGYLSLILMAITLVYLFCRKTTMRKIFIISMILLCVIAIITPIARDEFASFIKDVIQDQSGKSDVMRINLLKNGLYFLKNTYGLGIGAGNLYLYLAEYAVYDIGELRFIHNWYMEILVTFGVFFFVIYMTFHINIIFKLIKSYKKTDSFWNYNNTLIFSFIIFTLVSISSSSNIYSEWIWMYLVFIGSYVMFECNQKKNGFTCDYTDNTKSF